MKTRVGIIGCGAIGREIAQACSTRLSGSFELIALCDADESKALAVNGLLKKKACILSIDELVRQADLVIEAASASISAGIVEKCVKKKRSCLVMSVGGLIGKERLMDDARKAGVKLYIPSGALCGIDGLKAAAVGKIESVTLVTRKPLKGLAGAPYIIDKGIDLSAIKDETLIFEGSATQAVKGFPQNVNVSAVLSLAGIGADRTRVKIMTSPAYTMNIHEVEIAGDFGKITTRTENVPSAANPKTSAMAINSAIATLEGIASGVRIGN